jgi:hypothetical protein
MKLLLPVLVSLSLTSSPIPSLAQRETLTFKLGLDWVSVNRIERAGHVTIEYLRHGDDIDHPKERFAYQNGILRGKQTPEEEFNTMKTDAGKECPGATDWNVIAQDGNSILYESQSKQCGGRPDNHVIARIIHGRHNVFALIYVSTGHDLDPVVRAKWIGILQDASVESDAQGVKPVAPLDVDEVIPVEIDKVISALKPAMESVSCNVKESTAVRVECKRPRNSNGNEGGFGGESVTAELEAQGNQTRIRITTGKGFYGRLGKQNWSTAVFNAMMKNLQTAKP